MGRNLTNLYVSESFNHVLQISGSDVQNGLGESISGSVLDLQVASASYATYSELAGGSTIAVSASHAVQADSASYTPGAIVTGSISATTLTFTKGDGSSFDLEVTVSASAESASYASFAETANTANSATDATYAQNTITTGKNLEITTIAKGTPLYFTGSGTSGNLVGIYRADAGNPNRMPAGGVAGEAINAGAEGVIILDGFINGVDTSAFASGEKVYVGVGGGYTNVEPTGSSNLIQYLGNVEKSAINGSGVIQMMGEARRLPNIQQNYLWKGDANDVPQAVAESSLSVGTAVSSSHAVQADSALSANTATSASHALVSDTVNDSNVAYTNVDNVFGGLQTFNNINVNGTGSFAYIQSVTGSAKIIGDAFLILNNDTPSERYAGIKVLDSGSGSPLTTASLEFDGQSNDWFYEYSNDGGVTTDHGIVIFGPEYDTKGSPTYLTSNTIPKSSGSHHIVDSSISDDGSTVTIGASVEVTGNLDVGGYITPASGRSLDLLQYSGSDLPSSIRFYSGSTKGANFVNMQVVPGSDGDITISSFPSNNHFFVLDVTNFRTHFDGQIAGYYGNDLNIYGNVQVTGSLTQAFNAPALNNEVAFANVYNASVNGKNYNRVFFGMADYAGSGIGYEDYFAIEYYDSFGYNFGSEFDINGYRTALVTVPSGSGFAAQALFETKDNYDGTSQASVHGNILSIGTLNTNTLTIGRTAGSTTLSGSVSFEQTVSGTITNATSASLSDESKNNNANSGSIGFWQGTQAEYNLISGSASNDIIYFVV